MKVLVTDSQVRNAVAVIRSLGKRGIEVISADSDRISTGFFSKYTSEKFIYPDIVKFEGEFVDQLSSFVDKNHVDIIFPIRDEAIIAIAKHRNRFDSKVSIPITDYDTLIKAANKAITFKLLEQLRIPIPCTFYPEILSDLEDIEHFPVIIKPVFGSGSRGLALCHDLNELRREFKEKSEEYNGLIVQEYIPIDGHQSAEFCWYGIYDWDATCKGYGCYKAIRSYPIGSGPSTVQESVEIERINEIAFKVLDHIEWKGLVQIDFRIDARDSIPKLLEINARAWAPLYHSIKAGLDVPGLWLKLALGEPIVKQPPIKLGVKTRWLLPGDILWFLSARKNFRNIKDFFTFTDIDYDLIQKEDMKPIFGFFLASLVYLFKKEKRQAIIRKKVG